MKSLVLQIAFALTIVTQSFASLHPLTEVNKEWLSPENARYLSSAPGLLPKENHHEMIRLHLSLVERVLRNAPTAHLSASLRAAREKSLDDLNAYWRSGMFPTNTYLSFRNPVFIDASDNFCAVGYLIKSSGYESLARKISRNFNLCYLREISLSELSKWVARSGFSLSELAWIQPGYNPITYIQTIGSGVNGTVQTMVSDPVNSLLYMGGDFSHIVDGAQANHIAAYNPSAKAWQTFGQGFNAPVRKLLLHNNTVFACGSFTESGSATGLCGVAKWNGSVWAGLGSLSGTVYDMTVFDGSVFIAGNFTFTYLDKTYRNLAKWSGAYGWLPVCDSIDGEVRCLTNAWGKLLLGGNFTKVSTTSCRNVAMFIAGQFYACGNGPEFPVHSLAVAHDSIYAAGPVTLSPDTLGLSCFPASLTGAPAWRNMLKDCMAARLRWYSRSLYDVAGISNLIAQDSKLIIMGDFRFSDGGMGYRSGRNILVYDLNNPYEMEGIGLIDSTVHTACSYKDGLAFGGAFKQVVPGGRASWYPWKTYNHVAYTDFTTANSIDEKSGRPALSIFPNPFTVTAAMEFAVPVTGFTVYDLTGKKVHEWNGPPATEIALEREWFESSGTHIIQVSYADGQRSARKIEVN